MARKRTDAELITYLGEQVQFLENSAAAFDGGFEGEAKRLATTIRTLLHDTSKSHSILSQLGVKDRMAFMNTAEPINPRNRASTLGLVIMKAGVGGEYVAPLDKPGRAFPPTAVPFGIWWEGTVTNLVGDQAMRLSRRDYVLMVANQEGGAHVDPDLNEDYELLVKDNAFGWVYTVEDGAGSVILEKPFDRNPALASLRQIAFELMESLHDQLEPTATDRQGLFKSTRAVAIPKNTARNAPCPCGSGKKYKKCHGA
jgi:hypothetical protein